MNRTSPCLHVLALALLFACGGERVEQPAAVARGNGAGPTPRDAAGRGADVEASAALGRADPSIAVPMGKGAGKRIAVLVGVGEYALLGDLAMPTKDTEDLRRTLTQIGFECAVLHDQSDAPPLDVAAVESALTRYALSTDPDDVFLFYFSGHGFSLSTGAGSADFVCPRSADPADPSTSLSIDRVRAILTDPGCKAAHRIVILDACRNVVGRVDPSLRSQLLFGDGSFAALDRAGLTVLSSTSPGHVSLELARGTLDNEGVDVSNGLFTHFLLKAFSAKADDDGDGQLTFAEVAQHVARSMLDFSLRNNHRYQIPYWDDQMQRSDVVLCNVGSGAEGQENEAYALFQQAVRMPGRPQIVEFLKNKVLGRYHADASFRQACDKAVERTLAGGLAMRAKIANTNEALLGVVEFCLGVDGMGENCIRSLAVGVTPEELESRILFLHAVASIESAQIALESWIDELLAPCVRLAVQHQKWRALDAMMDPRHFRRRVACVEELQRSMERLSERNRPSDVRRLIAAFADDGLMPLYAEVLAGKQWDLAAAHLAIRAKDASGLVGDDKAQAESAIVAEMRRIVDGELAANSELAPALGAANAVLTQFDRMAPLAPACAALARTWRPDAWARVERAAATAADKAAVDAVLACRDLAVAVAGAEASWQSLVERHRSEWLARSLAAMEERPLGEAVDPAHLRQIRELAGDDVARAEAAARLRALALANAADPARTGAVHQLVETAMACGLARAAIVADFFAPPAAGIAGDRRRAMTRLLLAFVGGAGTGADLHEACLRLLEGTIAERDAEGFDALVSVARGAPELGPRVRRSMEDLLRAVADAPDRASALAFLASALARRATTSPSIRQAPDLRLLALRESGAEAAELDAAAALVARCRNDGAAVEEVAGVVAWCARHSTRRLESRRLSALTQVADVADVARQASIEELTRMLASPPTDRSVPIASFALEAHRVFAGGITTPAGFPGDMVRALLTSIVDGAELAVAEPLLRSYAAGGLVVPSHAMAAWARLVARTEAGDANLAARIAALRASCGDGALPKVAIPRVFAHFVATRDWEQAHALLALHEAVAASPDGLLVRDVVALRDRIRGIAADRDEAKTQVVIEKRSLSAADNRRTTIRSFVDIDVVDGFQGGGAITEELRAKGRLRLEIGERLRLHTEGRPDLQLANDAFPLTPEPLRCGLVVLRAAPAREGELQVVVSVALPDRNVVPLDSFPCGSPWLRRAVCHGAQPPKTARGEEFEWPLVVDDKQPLVFALGGFPLAGDWELTAELHVDPELAADDHRRWSESQRKVLAKNPDSARKAVLRVQFGNGDEQVVALGDDLQPRTIRVPLPRGAGSLTLQGSGDWPGRNFIVLEGARLARKP